ncbi:hypothetical protein [Streptomyces sp. H27-D2]|uniref:hypothetical protein n=1 Tax=Streptomyces sp. H27-D2 TaxID=3046304 RepID=UPI002DBC44D4|nr:hypothetical protein [Streptomyces sp. H27-D2]MEC4019902.1 hypothetical protein [Streptomyces sp. H27-D2]
MTPTRAHQRHPPHTSHLPVQQWLLENVLSLDAAGEDERPVQRTQDDKWELNSGRHGSSTPVKDTSTHPGNT